jgi:hypothetical protein
MALGAAVCPVAARAADDGRQELGVLSRLFHIDRRYASMAGPAGLQDVRLVDGGARELIWLTGARSDVLAGDGTPMSAEFLCHADLRNAADRRRFFTMVQGQPEIRLPEGFGVPIYSDEPLATLAMVLNHNREDPVDLRVRNSFTFVRERDLTAPLQPLFWRRLMGHVMLEGEHAAHVAHDEQMIYTDEAGKTFSGHWVVPPGRHTYRSRVTPWMRLPFDTTVHYIHAHVHPYAESIALRDATADRLLFQGRVTNYPDRIGLQHLEHFSSLEGVPVYKDHEYELISVYDNTTTHDLDAMAILYLYLAGQELLRPAAAPPP